MIWNEKQNIIISAIEKNPVFRGKDIIMLRIRPYNIKDADHSVSDLMAFTAIDDDDVVGFFTMRRPTESFDELRFGFVIVDSNKRGKGYGKQMLKQGLIYAKEIFGAKKVSLGVFKNNEPAYYCYKAAGFKDIALDEVEKYQVLGEECRSR